MTPDTIVMMDQIRGLGWDQEQLQDLMYEIESLMDELETDSARTTASWLAIRVWHAISSVDGTTAHLLCGTSWDLPSHYHLRDTMWNDAHYCAKCGLALARLKTEAKDWRREDLRVGGDRKENEGGGGNER